MSYITTTMDNLIHQTAFFNMTWGNVVMILVACVFLYLAIANEFRAAAACPDCIWHAACKYLPGYHAEL